MMRCVRGIIVGLLICCTAVEARADNFQEAARAFGDGLTEFMRTAGRPARLALVSDGADALPVSSGLVDAIEGRMAASLLDLDPPPRLIARRELAAMIGDLAATGALGQPVGNPVADLLERARDIDALAVGRYSLAGGSLRVRFRLVTRTGRILAVTPEVVTALKPGDIAPHPDALPLERVVEEIGGGLTEATLGETTLLADAILRGDGGATTDFGRYVRRALIGRLLDRTEGAVGARRPEIIDGGAAPGEDRVRFLGRYWDLGGTVALSVDLEREGRIVASWLKHVRSDSIGAIGLAPDEGLVGLAATDRLGPNPLRVSPSRGSAVFRIGEPLSLDVRLARGGWLWCFYLQSDGEVRQVLPNPGMIARRGSNWIEAGVARRLPDPARDGFRLLVSHPAGTEFLKCLATDRDVGSELPEAMRGTSLAPLPDGLKGRFVDIFRGLPDLAISEASLFLTVIDPDQAGTGGTRP
jgi:hypothetical protein